MTSFSFQITEFVFPAILFTAAAFYFFRLNPPLFRKKIINISLFAIGAKTIEAVLRTVHQYRVWESDKFTRSFLDTPIPDEIFGSSLWNGLLSFPGKNLAYFFYYSWSHFWLGFSIALGVGLLIYLFLRGLQRKSQRFFEEGEAELGFLCAFLSGWPGVTIFLPLVFLSVVAVSAFRMAALRENLTTLGVPFLLAAFLVLVWGSFFIELLGFGVLRV